MGDNAVVDQTTNQQTTNQPVLQSGFVPVINIGSARSGDPDARRQAAEAIDQAFRTSGFLVIVNHGVPHVVIDAMYSSMRQLFSLPDNEKATSRADSKDAFGRGFGNKGSLGASNRDAVVDIERQHPDLAEKFTYNRLGDPGVNRAPDWADDSLWSPNKWPRLAGVEQSFHNYYAEMEALATELMRLAALALQLPEHWFDDKFDNHMTNLIANYYPPQPTPPEPGQLRLGKHTDWSSLTILFQDTMIGGLQVLSLGGEWLDVPVIPDSFVINIGDFMSVWTNNRWVSTVHRVQNPPREFAHTERYSLPFFYHPNYDLLVECIPTCAGPDNPPQYPPVYSGPYILDKFIRSYG